MEILDCRSQAVWPSAVSDAAKVIRDGGLIVYPTETLYGLGADPFQTAAFSSVNKVKGRSPETPISIAVNSIESARQIAQVSRAAEELMNHFLPGSLTIILPSRSSKSPVVEGGYTIGLRIPDHPLALRLLEVTGPITATSANLHGGANPQTVEIARTQLGDLVGLYLDAGPCSGIASTVIELTDEAVKTIRKGAVPSDEVKEFLRHRDMPGGDHGSRFGRKVS